MSLLDKTIAVVGFLQQEFVSSVRLGADCLKAIPGRHPVNGVVAAVDRRVSRFAQNWDALSNNLNHF